MSISLESFDPIRVKHQGSFAFIYYADDTEAVRNAARGIIDGLNPDDPSLVVIDVTQARIYIIRLDWVDQ